MRFWQVDAFSSIPFAGNPAAVVIDDRNLSDELMQNIAAEMNLSETAFVKFDGDKTLIRWFTPKVEVDLCGHATLAAAHVCFFHMNIQAEEILFQTKFAGTLVVGRNRDGYTMNFPSRPGHKIEMNMVPDFVLNSLSSTKPVEAYLARDLMLIYENEESVQRIDPDFSSLRKFDKWIIVTSRSKKFDFISRFFCAGDGIDEDPVTGSAHCTLAPYWANVLCKQKMKAYQFSERGGELFLEIKGDRVHISGAATTVLEGRICGLR